jgi:hypothetical protein
LSLPYLGFLNKTHPAYVATRKQILSRGNPYYAAGKNFDGVGYALHSIYNVAERLMSNQVGHMLTPGTLGNTALDQISVYTHVSYRPMSQISAIFGTDSDDEIMKSLYTIANVSFIPF